MNNMMNRQLKKCVETIVLLIAVIFAGDLSAKQKVVSVTLQYQAEDLTIGKDNGYDVVTLDGATFPEDEAGTPLLPAVYINVLLPAGSTVLKVEAGSKNETLVGTGLFIHPAQMPVPLEEGVKPEFIKHKAAAYGKTTKNALYAGSKPRHSHGATFVPVRLNPVRYIPATGELYLAGEIKVNVTVDTASNRPKVRAEQLKEFSSSIKSLVVNPDESEGMPLPLGGLDSGSTTQDPELTGGTALEMALTGPLCEYLVITKESFRSAFQPLANQRASFKGLASEIVSTESIYATYTGRDNPEKIRNCIKDYAANRGTIFVALGGDDTVVPVRNCALICNDIMTDQTNQFSATVPVDLYYAGLDGNWDADGDARYGELNTTLGDEADLIADVWLGRIPVRTTTQATDYINKLINYENNPPLANARKFITGGNTLWDGYSGVNRPSDLMNDGHVQFMASNHPSVHDTEPWMRRAFRDAVQAHGWAPSQLVIFTGSLTSFDSTTAGDYSASGLNMASCLNQGWNIATWLAHGKTTNLAADGGTYFSTTEAASLTGLTAVFYTGACHSGRFTSEPCLSKAMLRNPVGGSLVYFGNAHWNFGIDDPSPADSTSTCGTTMEFIRSFTDVVFRDQVTNAAKAFYDSKAAFIGQCGFHSTYRWDTLGISYQGDPAFSIIGTELGWNSVPVAYNDTYVGTQNTLLTVNTPRVIANDCDLNNDTLTAIAVALPAHGTLSLSSDGSFTYMPAASYTGPDSFSYKATDGQAESNVATVTVHVVPTVKPTVKLVASDSSATEVGDKGTYDFTLTTGVAQTSVAITYSVTGTALAGSDYPALSGSVTIPAGATKVTVNVIPLNDINVEGAETITVTLKSSPYHNIYSSGAATVTIHDDEKPTVTVTATDTSLAEPTNNGQIKVTLTPAPSNPMTINYTMAGTAIQGVDYETLPGTVTFASGVSTALINIVPLDDALVEASETVTLKISANSAYYGIPSKGLNLISND
jgi:hypothetical protein